jgi:hypothetical protein
MYTNTPAQPTDPASRAATTEVKQGEEQIKHGEAFTLRSELGPASIPRAAATFNRRLHTARAARRRKIACHGRRPP